MGRQRIGSGGGRLSLFGALVAFGAAMLVITIVVGDLWVADLRGSPAPRAEAKSVSFDLCGRQGSVNCVVDGDTIRVDGVKIRVADIDTPEVYSPQCASEKRLGDRATLRMLELLNDGPIEVGLYARDADRYGRKLRVIRRNGRSLGEVLVAEGLARRWDGARHSWCG